MCNTFSACHAGVAYTFPEWTATIFGEVPVTCRRFGTRHEKRANETRRIARLFNLCSLSGLVFWLAVLPVALTAQSNWGGADSGIKQLMISRFLSDTMLPPAWLSSLFHKRSFRTVVSQRTAHRYAPTRYLSVERVRLRSSAQNSAIFQSWADATRKRTRT